MMGRKLGLAEAQPDDRGLVTSLLNRMKQRSLDYTVLFARLGGSLSADDPPADLERDLGDWYGRWRARLSDRCADEAEELMRRHNPVVIPRNHHVEAVIEACTDALDPAPAQRLLDVLRAPYEELAHTADYQDPPTDNDRGYQTFCGT